MSNLPTELLVSTLLVSGTVVIHLIGLDALLLLTDLHLRLFEKVWVGFERLLAPLGVVVGLFVVHGVEIWLYAFAYIRLGILPDIEKALYVSTSAYSTVGEAGAVVPEPWRIVGVLEAVNGMLLIGWSTAFLFKILDHLLAAPGDESSLPKGVIAARRGRRKR